MPPDVPHRSLGASTYNACFDLLDEERSAEEDLDLLELAFASRHHWRRAGGAREFAISDWMVSRCFAALGQGELSLRFAQLARDEAPHDAPAWLRASLLEGLARAHAACGEKAARDDAVRAATGLLADEPDEESRAVIAAQLATVPTLDA